jgi:hypothetical protein
VARSAVIAMRALLPLLLLLPLAAVAEPTPYAPLAFLAGHCWKGDLPGGKDSDEHCFTWVYGGKFLRDVHTVRGSGHADYLGESTYLWNAESGRLEYLYMESQGGSSRGSVVTEDSTLVFPPTRYVENGKAETYRSRWTRSGDAAYDVLTEFEHGAEWVEGFRVHMVRRADD